MNVRLRDDIYYATKGDKHLFLSPSVPDWLVVNRNGAAILGLCDGTRSTTQIMEALGVSGNDLADDIQSLLTQAGSHSLLAEISGEAEPVVRDSNANHDHAHSSPLHTIHLQLTNKCNYRCSYCYAGSGVQSYPMLPLEILTKVVDEATSLSPHCRYELSGGEPLLYPHIFELSEYIKSKDSPMYLLTNGSLISEKNYRRVAELYDFVKISLDGPTPQVNDRTRGKGTYKKARRAIDLLRSTGIPVSVSMTVTHNNIDHVPAMVREFGNILKFAPVFPTGRGSEKDDLCITGEEYYYALASVPGVNPLSSLHGLIASGRGRKSTRCAMADTEISIADDGSVYPCQLLHEPEFCAGNVLSEPLRTIYESERFRELRRVDIISIAECRECPIRYLCAGACRARSYFECGSIHVSGDFCAYEKLAYVNGLLDAATI
jgi:radical SAM protein with 4Fe4S-binding SPASM domain